MKKLFSTITTLLVALAIVMFPLDHVWAEGLALSVSASSINIEDTVTVTIDIPSGYGATVAVSYNNSVLEYVSSSLTANANAGTVLLNLGDAMGFANTATVTFKGISAGSSNLSANCTVAGNAEGDSVELTGASGSVVVENAVTEPDEPQQPGTGDGQENNNNASENNNAGNDNSGNAGTGSSDDNTASEPRKSADNSLSTLTLSEGTLSPEFKYNTIRYTATVDYDVTSVQVTAKTSNKKATIESMTGNENLKVGENDIKIVVKAENGVSVTYTVVVTRLAEGQSGANQEPDIPVDNPAEDPGESGGEQQPEDPAEGDDGESLAAGTFEIDGEIFHMVPVIPAGLIPENFSVSTVMVGGAEYQQLVFDVNPALVLIYLENEDQTQADFYVYLESLGMLFDYVRFLSGQGFIIPLTPPVDLIPDGCPQNDLVFSNGKTVTAYQYITNPGSGEEDFYLVYAINSLGELGWYQFDIKESTYQRYVVRTVTEVQNVEVSDGVSDSEYEKLSLELSQQKTKNHLIICIFVFVIVILLIIILTIAIAKRDGGYDDEEEDEEDEDGDDEDEVVIPRRNKRRAVDDEEEELSGGKSLKERFMDFFLEDEEDEEAEKQEAEKQQDNEESGKAQTQETDEEDAKAVEEDSFDEEDDEPIRKPKKKKAHLLEYLGMDDDVPLDYEADQELDEDEEDTRAAKKKKKYGLRKGNKKEKDIEFIDLD